MTPAPARCGRSAAGYAARHDKVEWSSSQGRVSGTVAKKLTSPTEIKGHHVAALPDNPEYLVQSAKTGAPAAHKADALKKPR
ncbi:MAG: DUF2945 domain-containing protein [Candidatus Velthaea sp.]